MQGGFGGSQETSRQHYTSQAGGVAGGRGVVGGSNGSSSVEHSPVSTHSTDVGDGEMADVEDNTGPTPLPTHDDTGPLDDDDGSVVVSILLTFFHHISDL